MTPAHDLMPPHDLLPAHRAVLAALSVDPERPVPTNRDLAAALGLRDHSVVSSALLCLCRRGLLAIEWREHRRYARPPVPLVAEPEPVPEPVPEPAATPAEPPALQPSPWRGAWGRKHPPELVARVLKLTVLGMSHADVGRAVGLTKNAVTGILARADQGIATAAVAAPTPTKDVAPSGALPRPLVLEKPGCRWPMWSDRTDPTFLTYCDAATPGGRGSTYCAEHAAKARSAVQPKPPRTLGVPYDPNMRRHGRGGRGDGWQLI